MKRILIILFILLLLFITIEGYKVAIEIMRG